MDKVIQCIADRFIKYLTNNQYIDETKNSVYYYGTIVTIQSVLNLIATLIIGLVFGLFFENLCFFIVFKLIRKFSGGFHSKKFSICFIISIILNIIFLITYKIFIIYQDNFSALVVELVSSIIIVSFSPVINNNKVLSNKEFKFYKFVVFMVCLISFLCTVFLIVINNYFTYSISMALAFDSVFVLYPKIKYFKNKMIIKLLSLLYKR